MFCTNCAGENPDDAVFCCRCGTPMGTTKIPPAHGEKKRGRERRGSNTAMIIAMTVLMIIGAVISLILQKMKDTETAPTRERGIILDGR